MFMEKLHGYDEYMYNLNEGVANILNIWPMVGNYDVNEDSFVGNDIYFKGAMMLHCLRCIINNDSLFFSMIRDYAITRKFTTVSTRDFIAFVNNYAGDDYTSFFDKFLHDTSLPVLEYSFTRENGSVKLVYRWTEVENGFSMPFSISTDKGINIRLEGTSDTREVTIPDAEWFNFYNVWKGYEGCPVNGFTYYNTKWDR
jgi:aminopeptidase N